MGTHDVRDAGSEQERRRFLRALLDDLEALERMLEAGTIESGVRRIGAEQELVIVNEHWKPAPVAEQLLEQIRDPHFTPELARFNLEFNLDPLPFGERCLSEMEAQASGLLAMARQAARESGHEIVMAGILPTYNKTDLVLENMWPSPRYAALNELLTAWRGGSWELAISGADELRMRHDSIMFEACNTSFQVHFQVGPDEFARMYNTAQVAAAPVLAAAANSPLFFGKRLWHETRIALFQQSLDTRQAPTHRREHVSRVDFGRNWITSSVLEIFQEDVARFRVLLAGDIDEDPLAVLEAGGVPRLQALALHNGTVYRWNRACYGISNGRPHLRIENRMLPSGPSIADEIANAALWFGTLNALLEEFDAIDHVMDFADCRGNFFAAARRGLQAQFTWTDGKTWPAGQLLLEAIIPAARRGLEAAGIDPDDVERYLDIVERRVRRERNGARWQLDSLSAMAGRGTTAERMHAITAAMCHNQEEGIPVASWPLAELGQAGGWRQNYLKVEQFMETDIISVAPEDPVELVARLMVWNRARHVLVEDGENRPVGIVSQRRLLQLVGRTGTSEDDGPVPVSKIMHTELITVEPDTTAVDAIDLMHRHGVSILPVIQDGRLVGYVTEHTFLDIARELLLEHLANAED